MDEVWIIVGPECPSMHISNGCPHSQCPHPRNKGIVTDTLRLSTLMEVTEASPPGTCGCQGHSRPTLTDLGTMA